MAVAGDDLSRAGVNALNCRRRDWIEAGVADQLLLTVAARLMWTGQMSPFPLELRMNRRLH